MWNLYKELGENKDTENLLREMNPTKLLNSLEIMYERYPKENLVSNFLYGLEYCEYFSFDNFIRAFHERR